MRPGIREALETAGIFVAVLFAILGAVWFFATYWPPLR